MRVAGARRSTLVTPAPYSYIPGPTLKAYLQARPSPLPSPPPHCPIVTAHMRRAPSLTQRSAQGQPQDSALLPPLARCVGSSVALLHNAGITHGDLTSSNFIVQQAADACPAHPASGSVFIIDFGLSFNRLIPVTPPPPSPPSS